MLELQSAKAEKGQQYRVVKYWKNDILAKVWCVLYVTAYIACQLRDDPVKQFDICQYNNFCELNVEKKSSLQNVIYI